MPEINEGVRNRLASVDVNQLDIHIHVDTLLVLSNVPTNIFIVDVCRRVR